MKPETKRAKALKKKPGRNPLQEGEKKVRCQLWIKESEVKAMGGEEGIRDFCYPLITKEVQRKKQDETL